MKDDVVSQMLGGDPLQEFTGTGAMGTVEVVPIGVNLRRKRFKRKKLAEATTKGGSLIPSDAEKISSTGTGQAEEDDDDETEAALGSNQELLQPELALVAPDCTPNATKPIDPAKVPASAPKASVPPLSTVQHGQEDPRAASVLGLFTQSQSHGPAVESLAPGLVPGVSGEALMHGGMPPPSKPTSAAVKSAMNRFRFG